MQKNIESIEKPVVLTKQEEEKMKIDQFISFSLQRYPVYPV